MPAGLGVVAGVALGLFVGGRFRNISTFHLTWEWLVIPMYIAQAWSRGRILWFSANDSTSGLVWVSSSIVLILALGYDLKIPGVLLLWTGTLLNLEVFLINGAMPVGLTNTLLQTTSGGWKILSVGNGFYRMLAESTLGGWLGDVIPFSIGGGTWLLSVGDVLLAVGVSTAVIAAMARSTELDSE